MNFWVISGTGCLGLVIGWLVYTFVQRAKTLTIAALSAVSAIVAGGGVLALWKGTGTGGLTSEANSFFVGLALSVMALGALNSPDQNSTEP